MPWELAAWGLFGSLAIEGLDMYKSMRRYHRWPWRVRGRRNVSPAPFLVAEFIRIVIGTGLALAAARSGQVVSPMAALSVGVAAPLMLERLLGSGLGTSGETPDRSRGSVGTAGSVSVISLESRHVRSQGEA